jgi:hypothetical protein
LEGADRIDLAVGRDLRLAIANTATMQVIYWPEASNTSFWIRTQLHGVS